MITERDFDNHIAWAQADGQRGDWTPARDALLVELLCMGRGLTLAAEAMGVEPAVARARWDALYPVHMRGLTWQPILLRILRRNREGARLRAAT